MKFEKFPVKKLGILGRLSKASRYGNAAAEIWNLIAEARSASAVEAAQAQSVLLENKVNTKDALWLEIIRPSLTKFIDAAISSNEISNPKDEWMNMGELFGGAEEIVDEISDNLLHDFFRKWWRSKIVETNGKLFEVIENEPQLVDRVQKESKDLLEKFGLNIEFDNEDLRTVLREKHEELWGEFKEEIQTKERLSPNGFEDFQRQLYENLNVNLTISGDLEAEFEGYEKIYRLENSPLQPIEVPINLQSKESAYFWCNARHLEEKINGYEPVGIDGYGELFITNKRIIFKSDRVTSVTWGRIIDIEVSFDDGQGIYVYKSSGKPLVFDDMTWVEFETIQALYKRKLAGDY